MSSHSVPYYNQFYRNDNSWGYHYDTEKKMICEQVLPYLQQVRGSRILDLGCGDGFHSKILYDLGFEVCGVDNSEEGIVQAKKRSDAIHFICADASNIDRHFQKEFFNCIYSRGLSWYHYELNNNNQYGIKVMDETKKVLEYLKDDGVFILQIATDYSGSHDAASGIINNTLENYISFFQPLGNIYRVSDWKCISLNSDFDGSQSHFGITLFLKKPVVKANFDR